QQKSAQQGDIFTASFGDVLTRLSAESTLTGSPRGFAWSAYGYVDAKTAVDNTLAHRVGLPVGRAHHRRVVSRSPHGASGDSRRDGDTLTRPAARVASRHQRPGGPR